MGTAEPREPRPAKRAKVQEAEADAEWPASDEEWCQAEVGGEDQDTAPAQSALPEQAAEDDAANRADFEAGSSVLYWDGWRGTISDEFADLDEFWVASEESGEIVRDEQGDIVHFKSAELQLVAGPPIAPVNPIEKGSPGGVILIGDERQMMKILAHFGTPETNERHQPQVLLAFPCDKLEENSILTDANQGIEDGVRKLANTLREDIHVGVRAYHLKQAVRELGADLLRMEGFFLLSSVSLPYSWDDIEQVKGWQKRWRRDICNQIDVGTSARGLHAPGDSTAADTARRVLGTELGIALSLVLWDPEVQANIRRMLDIDLPLSITDVNGGEIVVLLLPSDAMMTIDSCVLSFTEAPDAEYLAEGGEEDGDDVDLDAVRAVEEPSPPTPPRAATQSPAGPQGKNIAQWEKEQAQFADLPKLPPDWLRIKSSSGEVYFFNKKTQKATFDLPESSPAPSSPPLPAGWTKQVSKSTGKPYYFHSARAKSQFNRPTE